MKFLLDTHIWVWHLIGSEQLSLQHRKLIDSKKNQLWLSPISVWEVLILAQKERLKLKPSPQKWVKRAILLTQIQEAALNFAVAQKSQKIKLPHRDPADRFIAATAIIYDLTLITADKIILKSSIKDLKLA